MIKFTSKGKILYELIFIKLRIMVLIKQEKQGFIIHCFKSNFNLVDFSNTIILNVQFKISLVNKTHKYPLMP